MMSRVLAFISMLFAMSQVQRSPAKPPLAAPRRKWPLHSPFSFSSEQALVLSSVHSSVQKSRTAGAMSGAILRSTSAVKNGCSCLACVMRGHAAGCPCKDCASCPTKYLPHGPGCLCGSCA